MKQEREESLTQWMNEFLEVGKRYVIFSVSGSVFVGVYKGISYDYLLFKLDSENNLYMNPNNIELIKEEKGG
jgi:ferredoxin-fold anticodon binding domain-containing protein